MEQIVHYYSKLMTRESFPENEWEIQLQLVGMSNLPLILLASPSHNEKPIPQTRHPISLTPTVAWEWDASPGRGDLVFQCDEGHYLVIEVRPSPNPQTKFLNPNGYLRRQECCEQATEYGHVWKSFHCEAQVTYGIYTNMDGLVLLATI
jgi:hypothetical protein